MTDRTTQKVTAGTIVDVVLPLFLLSLLVALCIQLLVPFVGLLVWTIILAICFKPLHDRLMAKRGLSSRWSAIIIGSVCPRLSSCLRRLPRSARPARFQSWLPRSRPGIGRCRLHLRA